MSVPGLTTPDCPTNWEYKDHQHYSEARVGAALQPLLHHYRTAPADEQLALCLDTRPFHEKVFHPYTPAGLPYFAGHYRGEEFFCLKLYRVVIPADPRVGCAPELVSASMAKFADELGRAAEGLAFVCANPAWFDRKTLLHKLVSVTAHAFVVFLEIHPYANGNGHSARLLLNVLMGRFGFWLTGFPVHQRPFTNYGQLISEYRDGNKAPLRQFILNCL